MTQQHRCTIAIASRALFDLDESNIIFEKKGVEAYAVYQMEHEQVPLAPGPAFHLVKKLLHINELHGDPLVEVVLLSRNSADTGLRIFNSIEHYALPMTRAVFTGGKDPYAYLEALNAHLFLSLNDQDVRDALKKGFAAARLLAGPNDCKDTLDQVRVAFDGDAVLFSDQAERVYQQSGLDVFLDKENKADQLPLPYGPFKGFLQSVCEIQNLFPRDCCPIRTALVTARSAPAHRRVIHTFRHWNIRIDEVFFLGGYHKASYLKAFKADIFFDDQKKHCQLASEHAVSCGHVPNGICNRDERSDT